MAHCLAKEPARRPSPPEVIARCRAALPPAPPPPGRWLPPAVAAELGPGAAGGEAGAPSSGTRRVTPPGGLRAGARRRGVVVAAAAAVVALLTGAGLAASTWWGGSGDDAHAGDRQRDPDQGRDRGRDTPPPDPPEEPAPTPYRRIELPANHHLHLDDDPLVPTLSSAETMDDIDLRYDTQQPPRQLRTAEGNALVLLKDGERGSLTTCLEVTRFTQRIDMDVVSVGSQVCVRTDDGHVGLVTVTGRSGTAEPSDYLTVDVLVWRDVR